MFLEKVDKTATSIMALVIGGMMVNYAAGNITLTEALLVIIASAETIDVGFDYLSTQVE